MCAISEVILSELESPQRGMLARIAKVIADNTQYPLANTRANHVSVKHDLDSFDFEPYDGGYWADGADGYLQSIISLDYAYASGVKLTIKLIVNEECGSVDFERATLIKSGVWHCLAVTGDTVTEWLNSIAMTVREINKV